MRAHLALGLAVLLGAAVVTPARSQGVDLEPVAIEGDLVVDKPVSYVGKHLKIRGNLVLAPGGELSLDNCVCELMCTYSPSSWCSGWNTRWVLPDWEDRFGRGHMPGADHRLGIQVECRGAKRSRETYGDGCLAENLAEKDGRRVPKRAGDCRSEKRKKP